MKGGEGDFFIFLLRAKWEQFAKKMRQEFTTFVGPYCALAVKALHRTETACGLNYRSWPNFATALFLSALFLRRAKKYHPPLQSSFSLLLVAVLVNPHPSY